MERGVVPPEPGTLTLGRITVRERSRQTVCMHTTDVSGGLEEHRIEWYKEGATMALYVAICLFAALSIVTESELEHHGTTLKVIWGTTLGLALAHWFAFRLSTRLVAGGMVRRTDVELAAAQMSGAAIVAVLATIPVVVFDGPSELDAARLVIAVFIALVGFLVARVAGASVSRAVVYGMVTLVVAVGIALLKNTLSGH